MTLWLHGSSMGGYDHKRFRQIMVGAEVYRMIAGMRGPDETFSEVILRLMTRGRSDLKKGRSMDELRALARVARHRWDRMVRSGRVRVHGRS